MIKSRAPCRQTPRRWLRVTAGLLILGLAMFFAALQLLAGIWKGPTYKCLVEGPSSPLGEVSERSGIVTGSASFWPLGRECEWARADGAGTVTSYSGSWLETLVAVGMGAAGLALVFAPASSRGRTHGIARRSSR